MSGLEPLGRTLLVVGVVLVAVGLVFVLAPRVPFIGRLPGDIRIQRNGLTIYLPIATMLLLSVLVSVVLNVIGRGR